MKRALILSVLTLALAACGRSDETPDGAATPAASPSAAETGALALAPLQNDDGKVIGANMSNVGGCAFYDEANRRLLSVGIPDNYGLPAGAGGDAIGVARVNGEPVKLIAAKADAGYVEAGPKLDGGGFTLTVLRAQGEGKSMDMEQVQYQADLVVSDGGGDARTYAAGGWRCGV